jgi:hypothetical protein
MKQKSIFLLIAVAAVVALVVLLQRKPPESKPVNIGYLRIMAAYDVSFSVGDGQESAMCLLNNLTLVNNH